MNSVAEFLETQNINLSECLLQTNLSDDNHINCYREWKGNSLSQWNMANSSKNKPEAWNIFTPTTTLSQKNFCIFWFLLKRFEKKTILGWNYSRTSHKPQSMHQWSRYTHLILKNSGCKMMTLLPCTELQSWPLSFSIWTHSAFRGVWTDRGPGWKKPAERPLNYWNSKCLIAIIFTWSESQPWFL